MAPRQKVTREQIIDAACKYTLEHGFESLSARELSKALGCTTMPIYTYFSNMKELEDEVYNIVKNDAMSYISECLNYQPVFKEFGMRLARYANNKPNYYKMIINKANHHSNSYTNNDFKEINEAVCQNAQRDFHLTDAHARELFDKMFIFLHGIVGLYANGIYEYDEAMLSKLLSEMCLSAVCGCLVKENHFNEEMMKKMLSKANELPRKVK